MEFLFPANWYLLPAIGFWMSAFLVFHTYFLYPLLLRFWSSNRTVTKPALPDDAQLPHVSVLMAVYNEAAVIRQKMEALLALDYPADRLRIYVGSDRSSDGTNAILRAYAARYDHIHVWYAEQRTGKSQILNRLYATLTVRTPAAPDHLLLLTDANVFPAPDLLRQMIPHFQRPAIGLVDSHMQHVGTDAGGIAASEDRYIRREVRIKHAESQLWQAMIGPFGGCFMLRSDLYEPIPSHFKVDDFYLALTLLERGYGAVNELDAVCTETVGSNLSGEFRRKRRIGTGNFQNLRRFRALWLRCWTPVGFALLSHKVLRWLVPFFLIVALGGSLLLALGGYALYQLAFAVQVLLWFVLPLLDARLGIGGFARDLRYFVQMNYALLLGFVDWRRGVKDGTWEPVR